jgi:serine/threonine-protein kinase RsbW/stage II sporulation protein AB (anti-sigma F factor)
MPPAADRSELELQLSPEAWSVGRAREEVARYARECGAREDDVKLAVSEAVSNAVIHAFRDGRAGTISVKARTEPGFLHIAVTDDGIGMTPHLASPGLGLGVALITRVSYEVHFESTDAGTTVSMRFLI